MNKRVMILEEIARIAAELPDEEIRKLERLAEYLQVSQEGHTKDPLMDLIIGTFRQYAESKGAVLYSILFREAGIGLQWWEDNRAGARPDTRGMRLSDIVLRESEWNKRGLVVYKYYPTLSEAIAGEWKRLEEESK